MMRATLAAGLVVVLSGCLAGPGPDGLDAAAPDLACAPCRTLVDDAPGGGWEPHVAVHPSDPDHVVVASRAEGRGATAASYYLWFDVFVSRDGGATWNVTSLRHTRPVGEGTDPDAGNVVGDPVLAFLPDGTLLITGATLQYVAVPGGGVMRGVELYVLRSDDGGATFGEPVVVARSEGAVVQAALPDPVGPTNGAALLKLPDKPWLATGPDGTALLTWTGYVGLHPDEPTGVRSDILFSASTDGGRTWSEPGVVAPGGSLQGSAPAVGARGWYVAYADWEAGEARVAVSRDRGATWQRTTVGPHVWMPALAVEAGAAPGGADRLWLVTTPPDGPADPGAPDDAVQTPTLHVSDGGDAWSAPRPLDTPEAPGRVLPSVAAAHGVAYVTFAHPTDGPTAFHAVAVGPDGRLARTVLDAIPGPSSRMGDYLGLAAGPGGAHAAWTTTADGREYDVAAAGLRPDGTSANA